MKYVYYGNYNSGLSSYLNLDQNKNSNSKNIDNLLDEINKVLPESIPLHTSKPEWLKDNLIEFKKDGTLEVTFVMEGAGYQSALCYFIYDINNKPEKLSEINDIYILFPNFSARGSGGYLKSGDTMLLASEFSINLDSKRRNVGTPNNFVFKEGKGVGFLLIANGWRYDYVNVNNPTYSSISSMNPEKNILEKFHTVAVRLETDTGKIIMGFEDLNRTNGSGDNDFNDCVVLLTPNNIENIDNEHFVDENKDYPGAPKDYNVYWKKALAKTEEGDVTEVVMKLLVPKDAIQIITCRSTLKYKTNKAYIASIKGVGPKIFELHCSNKYQGKTFKSCYSNIDNNYFYNLYETKEIVVEEGTDFATTKSGIYFFMDEKTATDYDFSLGKIIMV